MKQVADELNLLNAQTYRVGFGQRLKSAFLLKMSKVCGWWLLGGLLVLELPFVGEAVVGSFADDDVVEQGQLEGFSGGF